MLDTLLIELIFVVIGQLNLFISIIFIELQKVRINNSVVQCGYAGEWYSTCLPSKSCNGIVGSIPTIRSKLEKSICINSTNDLEKLLQTGSSVVRLKR